MQEAHVHACSPLVLHKEINRIVSAFKTFYYKKLLNLFRFDCILVLQVSYLCEFGFPFLITLIESLNIPIIIIKSLSHYIDQILCGTHATNFAC